MYRKLTFWAVLFVMGLSLQAQSPFERDTLSCTSIMVGRKATVDGSVITSHTCDSWYRTWVNMVPAADYKEGTMTDILGGRMHTEFVSDQSGTKVKGQIPQVAHTYAFLDTAYPCMNERQLGIGETTVSGRRELQNPKGMFMIEELERVALQRCASAREAISLMGALIKEYGYGDSGECLTIADPQEVWHFEVFGEGPDNVGGVWAAVRIPDDEVGVSANISRIGTLNLKDKDNYMASGNVFEVARKLGFWDGKEPFKFWKAYSGKNYSGELKSYSVRELFILSSLAPSLGLNDSMEELPLSVKPEKLLAATDVMALLRQTYEGTDLDVTRNLKIGVKNRETKQVDTVISPRANPWMRSDEMAMLNGIKPGTVKSVRNVAVPQCAYSTVIQLRSWLPDAVGGIVWLALDNPGQSPRFPVFCGVTDLPELLKICGNHRYRDDAALWHYRSANKIAALKWGTYRKTLEKNRDYFEAKGQRELPFVESEYQSILKERGRGRRQVFPHRLHFGFYGSHHPQMG